MIPRNVNRADRPMRGNAAAEERRGSPVADELSCRPATGERWADVVALFGRNGACAGCWCMWWRRRGVAWERGRGAGHRTALRALVCRGARAPGLLAYAGAEPVGWVALAPRIDYERLAHSRVLSPVDDQPVWSITCFFVRANWRGRGVAKVLLRAAIAFARKEGAAVLESYPVETGGKQAPAVFFYTGTPTLYAAEGFVEVARRSPTRPIMRLTLRPPRRKRAPQRGPVQGARLRAARRETHQTSTGPFGTGMLSRSSASP